MGCFDCDDEALVSVSPSMLPCLGSVDTVDIGGFGLLLLLTMVLLYWLLVVMPLLLFPLGCARGGESSDAVGAVATAVETAEERRASTV